MFRSVIKLPGRSGADLLRALRVILWVVPLLMGVIGISFTVYEHGRHVEEPGWPAPTYIGIVVLGVVGPALSWLCIRWAIRSADAYLASQQALARRAEELAALNRLSVVSSRSLDLQKTLANILEQTMSTLDANAAMVFIQENERSGMRLEAHQGISLEMAQKEAQLAPGHCLCGQAVTTGRALFAYDVGSDPRCTSDLCICEGFRSVACAPLEANGQTVGLLQLASATSGHFTEEQRDFVEAVAAQVSVSVENARLYDTVRLFNVELEEKVNRRTQELEKARWALAEKARRLQRLLSESYQIQEDTQARIAHDMHDSVTQIIIGALYETQAARQALLDDPDRATESLQHAQQLLTDVEVEIRRVIYDLHPPVLDMMGLVVALKRFATNYQAAFNIACEVQAAGEPRRLPNAIEIAVYRIAQAALDNVASHAQAGRVTVHFDFGTAALQLAIQDNGIGFDPEKVLTMPGDHLGLIGMKERAEGLGADLTISSTPGVGSTVKLRLPEPPYLELESDGN